MRNEDGNLLFLPISAGVSMASMARWHVFQQSQIAMKIKAASKGINALYARMQKDSILMRKVYLLMKRQYLGMVD